MYVKTVSGAIAALALVAGAQAQVAVTPSGMPTYSIPVAVPPGISGMTPQLGLFFAGAGVNGPQGYGWSLQGISTITRCPASKQLDGAPGAVTYAKTDRLCLDGQRLTRTTESGSPIASTTDAAGVPSGTSYFEFRTEQDSYARIRAYGMASATDVDGPLYFKVWTKAGQIYEYGQPPSVGAAPAALIRTSASPAVMVWAVARVSDTLGNYMDFRYSRRVVAWGSGPVAGSATSGVEWNPSEIWYTGFSGSPSRAPYNKVVFDYEDRPDGLSNGLPLDRAEAYQWGNKTVSISRLTRIRAFVGRPLAQPVLVRSLTLAYERGANNGADGVTGRSRLAQVKECFGESSTVAGEPSTKCLEPTRFRYADTGSQDIFLEEGFNLKTLRTLDTLGEYGVIPGDFNGDGRSDLIRWTSKPDDGTLATKTRLFTSNGNGSFTEDTAFSMTDLLFTKDGCYYSMVADMNADGLQDIVRFAGDKKLDGSACVVSHDTSHIFVNNGNSTFTPFAITRTISGTPTAIKLQRLKSDLTSKEFCGPPEAAGQQALAGPPNCRTGHGWTTGANFYLLDVNADGRTDIVTTSLPLRVPSDPLDPNYLPVCPSQCTFVYLATEQNGSFTLAATNIPNQTLYSDPGVTGDVNWPKHVVDVDGDGVMDISGAGKTAEPGSSYGNWRSLAVSGRGDFALISGSGYCETPLDFNGDRRIDCLRPSSTPASNALYVSIGTKSDVVAGFNIHTAGLKSATTAPKGSVFGSIVFDFNADGRDDILRWHDTAASNLLYLANGDGTFKMVTEGYNTTRFRTGDGEYDSIFADFTGKGVGEILRLSRNAVGATDPSAYNNLYVRGTPEVPDRLLSVTSPTGLVTQLTYATVANAPAGRYTSDRGTSSRANYPDVDITTGMPIVITVKSDTGVAGGTATTEYAYRGLKADAAGRGLLGFREMRVQSPAPDGSPLTVATQYLNMRPYEGLASRSETRKADLSGYDSAGTLSRTVNEYCDTTSATLPSAASELEPCATTAKVTRPYLSESVETGADLDGTALPTVTTKNSFNNDGDPTLIVVTTKGVFDGVDQTYTKTTTNSYLAPLISGDYWRIGRLSDASVHAVAPNLNLTPSAGTAANATVTDGRTLPQNAAQAQAAPAQAKPTPIERSLVKPQQP